MGTGRKEENKIFPHKQLLFWLMEGSELVFSFSLSCCNLHTPVQEPLPLPYFTAFLLLFVFQGLSLKVRNISSTSQDIPSQLFSQA